MNPLFLQSKVNDKVQQIRFGVLSAEQIRLMSVCEVTSTLTFENGLPRKNGLMDPRMGILHHNYNCKTCFGDRQSCPGHFGRM